MIVALIHPPFIRGDQNHRALDPRRTGYHVSDKSFVSRDVDHAYHLVSDSQVSKTEVDGETPGAFLWKFVGFDSGKGAYERGFSVIDVTRSANYVHRLSLECTDRIDQIGCF